MSNIKLHTMQAMTSQKSSGVAIVLYFFLCIFAAHRFYTQGATAFNVVYLLTFGFCGIGWIIDFFLIWGMADKANTKALLDAQIKDSMMAE